MFFGHSIKIQVFAVYLNMHSYARQATCVIAIQLFYGEGMRMEIIKKVGMRIRKNRANSICLPQASFHLSHRR